MAKPILSVKDLTVAFGEGKYFSQAIAGVSFNIMPGQCVGLVGESGSGKTLTGLSIIQLLPHAAYVSQSSQIVLHEKDLLSISEKKMRNIRGRRIGVIFQDAMSAFNPVLTIGHQLMEVCKKHLKLNQKKSKEKVLSLLKEVGLPDPERNYQLYPHELSGGMRQRAMIAMSLCGEPELLIADEPTTALDVTIQAQILSLLKSLQNSRDMTLLFISHDLAVISQIADEIVVLQNGNKIEESSTEKFFTEPHHGYSKKLLISIPSNEPRYTAFSDSEKLLEVENLKVYFPIRSSFLRRTIGYVKAVDDISFNIQKGKTLALVGESGSGKTTTGKAIIKLIKATSGRIIFQETDLSSMSRKATRKLRENMQIIFQDPYASLNPRIMIGDSVAEGMLAQKIVKNRKEALEQVDKLLKQVDLSPEMKWRYPHEFSGGQRQRICIARALALSPKLLILDEPTSALDVSIQMQILQLLEKLQKEYQLSYLLITHNLAVVAYMSHYLAVMQEGKIVEQGQTKDILENPKTNYTKKLLSSIPKIEIKKEEENYAS